MVLPRIPSQYLEVPLIGHESLGVSLDTHFPHLPMWHQPQPRGDIQAWSGAVRASSDGMGGADSDVSSFFSLSCSHQRTFVLEVMGRHCG